MTVWDTLDKAVSFLPPIVASALLVAAVVVFIVGFARHGVNFVKYGFSQANQTKLDDLLDKLATKEDINGLRAEMKAEVNDLRAEMTGLRTEMRAEVNDLRIEMTGKIDGLRTELDMIKVNHFGHLKNYLTVLNGILLDKGVIDNESRARLDNELRGM